MDYGTLYSKLEASADSKLKTPLLVWNDNADQSEILVVATEDKISKINSTKEGNILALLSQIGSITNQQDALKSAYEGDELSYPIEPIELSESELNWQPLLKLVSETKAQEPVCEISLTPEVSAEIKNNFDQDVTAAAVDAVFHSIILYMAAQANTLGISSIGIVGELAYNERFRYLLAKNLSDEYEIRFAE